MAGERRWEERASGLSPQVAISDTMDELLNWISVYGYPALFLLLMLGIVGVPIPDEILLTCSGNLIFKDQLGPLPMMSYPQRNGPPML